MDAAGHHDPLTVDLAILFGNPMTGDAGDTFTRDAAPLPERRFARFAELRPDLLMTAHAERTDRPEDSSLIFCSNLWNIGEIEA